MCVCVCVCVCMCVHAYAQLWFLDSKTDYSLFCGSSDFQFSTVDRVGSPSPLEPQRGPCLQQLVLGSHVDGDGVDDTLLGK